MSNLFGNRPRLMKRGRERGIPLLRAGAVDLNERLEERDNHYSQVLGKLEKFKRGHRKRTALQQHKFDWSKEFSRLHQLAENQERELLVTQSPELLQQANNEVEQWRLQLQAQLREVKEVVASASEVATQRRQQQQEVVKGQPETVEGGRWGEGKQDEWEVARSMVAEMLLAVKEGQLELSRQLDEEAREAEDEARSARQIVLQVMQEDRRAKEVGGPYLSEFGFLQSVGDVEEEEAGSSYEVEMLRLEVIDRLRDIEQLHGQQLDRLADEGRQQQEAAGPYGGWSREDHERFVHVLKTAASAGPARAMERLKLAFPLVSMEEIKAHERWFRTDKFAGMKRQAILRAAESDREQLRDWARQAFAKARESAARERERAEEQAQWEAMRHERHEALQEMRMKRETEDEQRRQWQEQAEREREERERERRARESAEQEAKKGLVAAFHQRLALSREEERRRRQQQLAEEQQLRKQRLAETLERVTYRSQLLDERAAQAEEAKKRAAEEEERRMQALQRLAAQVPYAERLAAIEADPLKPTEFMKHNAFQPDDGSSAFRPMRGYTDRQLFKDVRFRLGLALQQAGLSHHAYARQVIAALAPRAPAPYV